MSRDLTKVTLDDADATAWGWKDIARVLGRGARTAQARAQRNIDPLPVFWEDDRVGAYVHAILRWRSNQRRSHKYHRELVALRKAAASSPGPAGSKAA